MNLSRDSVAGLAPKSKPVEYSCSTPLKCSNELASQYSHSKEKPKVNQIQKKVNIKMNSLSKKKVDPIQKEANKDIGWNNLKEKSNIKANWFKIISTVK